MLQTTKVAPRGGDLQTENDERRYSATAPLRQDIQNNGLIVKCTFCNALEHTRGGLIKTATAETERRNPAYLEPVPAGLVGPVILRARVVAMPSPDAPKLLRSVGIALVLCYVAVSRVRGGGGTIKSSERAGSISSSNRKRPRKRVDVDQDRGECEGLVDLIRHESQLCQDKELPGPSRLTREQLSEGRLVVVIIGPASTSVHQVIAGVDFALRRAGCDRRRVVHSAKYLLACPQKIDGNKYPV